MHVVTYFNSYTLRPYEIKHACERTINRRPSDQIVWMTFIESCDYVAVLEGDLMRDNDRLNRNIGDEKRKREA